jgi:hypothetical protein
MMIVLLLSKKSCAGIFLFFCKKLKMEEIFNIIDCLITHILSQQQVELDIDYFKNGNFFH